MVAAFVGADAGQADGSSTIKVRDESSGNIIYPDKSGKVCVGGPTNKAREEVENPHFEDGVQDIGEAQTITFKDCDTHAETITVQNYDACDGGKGCSEFDSEQRLGKGFETRVHFSNKTGVMKQVYRKQLVRNKQGFKCLKDKRYIGRQPKRRRETRTGCEAMFQIS
ncbi:hypothetical protein RJ640_016774 [Escallonia rubra]|uniref:FAR1 domain-containing protein n=1 Tax=Escallonia rubra TaxID=112253 RepID=A0AA88QW98_9ASTE|nr:hypothetical protein RJ640_016774 [Escallonia rubra]